IQIWAKHLVAAASAGLECSGGEHPRDKLRVPRSCECDRLRKTGAALAHVAVQYLIVKNRGDAEPRVLCKPLLHGVGKRRRLARTFAFSLACDLADAVLHHFRGFRRIKVAAIGREVRLWSNLWAVGPKTNELRNKTLAQQLKALARDLPNDRGVIQKPPAAKRHQVAELSRRHAELVLVFARQKRDEKPHVGMFGAQTLHRGHVRAAKTITRLAQFGIDAAAYSNHQHQWELVLSR